MNVHKRSPWVALTAILVYVFLYTPIVVLMLYSFNSSKTNIVFEGIVNRGPCGPFYWFCELAGNRNAIDAAQSTLIVASVSTIISSIIGTMAAIALQRYRFRLRAFSEAALYIPIVIPEIVMGIGILVFFSAIFSSLNSLLGLAGDARLSLGLTTVTVSHVAFSVPFVALVVRARLQGLDQSLEEAAMDLGANEVTTFRRITLPMIAPGVLSGAMLAFTLSLDDFIISFFTNGPGTTTLPIYVYGLLRRTITPEVNALSTVWILTVFIMVLLTQWMESRE